MVHRQESSFKSRTLFVHRIHQESCFGACNCATSVSEFIFPAWKITDNKGAFPDRIRSPNAGGRTRRSYSQSKSTGCKQWHSAHKDGKHTGQEWEFWHFVILCRPSQSVLASKNANYSKDKRSPNKNSPIRQNGQKSCWNLVP